MHSASLIFSQKDRMESQQQPRPRSQTPSLSELIPKRHGGKYSEQRLDSTTNEGAPMAESYLKRPTASVTEEKRQRRSSLSAPQFTRTPVCRQNLKPPIPTNQIRVLGLPARALPAGFCGYIKRGQLCRSHSSFGSGGVKVR